jgi:catechol 2,3-dioxygenase-like lactoylglutathione lyase family enzyme
VDPAKGDPFYKDILGFRLLWEGGPETNPHAYVSYLVPNGSDWLEYMTTANPKPKQLASMHHVALEVTDIHAADDKVRARGYSPPARPVVGRDGRWLGNFFDPDGTRTEIMIRRPVEQPCCSELHDPFILK